MKIQPQIFNQLKFSGLIFLLCFIFYGNTLKNGYVLDDAVVITNNKFTQQGLNGIGSIFAYDTFKGFSESMSFVVNGGRYRPLSVVSFAIEKEYFNSNPWVSHFINVFVYSLTCILFYVLLSSLFINYNTNSIFYSIPFISTILFLAHPIHTEVVANIKGRDEIFALLFSLLSFIFTYNNYKLSIVLRNSIAGFFFLLALLSKENAVVFLIIIPLTLYFFTSISKKEILNKSWGLLCSFILFLFIRHYALSGTIINVDYIQNISNDSFIGLSTSQKYATIVYTLGLYIKLIFWPHPLTFDYYPYHIPVTIWTNFYVILTLLTYLSLILYSALNFKNKNIYTYCILLFLIPIPLVSNIFFPIGTFFSERFLFLPSIGFAIFISFLIYKKLSGRLAYFILLPLLVLYFIKTTGRNKDWKSDLTLIKADVITSQNSFKSTGLYGNYLYELSENNYPQIIPLLEKSCSINPYQPHLCFILGTLTGKYLRDYDKAIHYLNISVKLEPNNADAYVNLTTLYMLTKNYDEAISIAEQGLKLFPNYSLLIRSLGNVYYTKGEREKANHYFSIVKPQ